MTVKSHLLTACYNLKPWVLPELTLGNQDVPRIGRSSVICTQIWENAVQFSVANFTVHGHRGRVWCNCSFALDYVLCALHLLFFLCSLPYSRGNSTCTCWYPRFSLQISSRSKCGHLKSNESPTVLFILCCLFFSPISIPCHTHNYFLRSYSNSVILLWWKETHYVIDMLPIALRLGLECWLPQVQGNATYLELVGNLNASVIVSHIAELRWGHFTPQATTLLLHSLFTFPKSKSKLRSATA